MVMITFRFHEISDNGFLLYILRFFHFRMLSDDCVLHLLLIRLIILIIYYYILSTWLVKSVQSVMVTIAPSAWWCGCRVSLCGASHVFYCVQGIAASPAGDMQSLHIVFLFFASVMFAISLVVLLGYHCALVASNRSTLGKYLCLLI